MRMRRNNRSPEELVLRLLEYKRYKEAAEKFRQMEKEQSRVFFRPIDLDNLSKYYSSVNPLEEVHLQDLLDYFQQAVSRTPARNLCMKSRRKKSR